MASNAFGNQKPPSGRNFRTGDLGKALKEVYKDVEAGFLALEASAAGVPIFSSFTALAESTATRTAGQVVSCVAGIQMDEDAYFPSLYQWVPTLSAADMKLEDQFSSGVIVFPTTIWETTKVGAWVSTVALLMFMGDEDGDTEKLHYPTPLVTAPTINPENDGNLNGYRFLTVDGRLGTYSSTTHEWSYTQVGGNDMFSFPPDFPWGITGGCQRNYVYGWNEDGHSWNCYVTANPNSAVPMNVVVNGIANSPAELPDGHGNFGETYLVGSAPSGAFASHALEIAYLDGNGTDWKFLYTDLISLPGPTIITVVETNARPPYLASVYNGTLSYVRPA